MYCVQYLRGKWFAFKKAFLFYLQLFMRLYLQVSQGAESPKDLNLLKEFFYHGKDIIKFTTEHTIS